MERIEVPISSVTRIVGGSFKSAKNRLRSRKSHCNIKVDRLVMEGRILLRIQER
jgi:hypothetical protein